MSSDAGGAATREEATREEVTREVSAHGVSAGGDPGVLSVAGAALESLSVISAGVDLLHGLLTVLELDLGQAQADAPDVLGGVLEHLDRLERRLGGSRLRILRLAERTATPAGDHHPSTAAWAAATTGTTTRQAAALTHLADHLAPVPDPATGVLAQSPVQQALDDGRITLAHAQTITRTLEQVPVALTHDTLARLHTHLIDRASSMNPARFARHARRALAALTPDPAEVDTHEHDQVTDQESRAHDTARFWMRDNHDGTHSGGFTIPWHAAATLHTILDAMTSPRRRTPPTATTGTSGGGTNPGTGSLSAGSAGPGRPAGAGRDHHSTAGGGVADEPVDWAHRRGLAFTDLLTRLPTDHLPTRTAATLIVHTHLDTLRGRLDKVCPTTAGEDLSAGTVRHLACGAGLVPAVLGTPSLPLDLGRATRLFSSAQRLALSHLYDTCAAHRCQRTYAWTELHHLDPWADGGRTDLANAVPLCGYHHRAIHRPGTRTTHTTDHDGRHTLHITQCE